MVLLGLLEVVEDFHFLYGFQKVGFGVEVVEQIVGVWAVFVFFDLFVYVVYLGDDGFQNAFIFNELALKVGCFGQYGDGEIKEISSFFYGSRRKIGTEQLIG